MFDLESRPVRLNPWISLLKTQLARLTGPRRRGQRARQRQWSRAIERLEERCLLAAPELVAVLPNVGSFLVDNQVRTQAPDELTLRFSPGQSIDVNSLGGIVLTRAGFDGDFEEANVYSDFNTNGAVVVEFDAQRLGVGGNGISVVVGKADLGLGFPPTISVAGTTITATLNSNVVTPTTAQSFVDAINNNASAKTLVQASIRSGLATTNIATPAIPSTLVLSGANAAVATSNFNTGTPLEVKFESKVTGPGGNGVSIVFKKANLGAAPGNPTVVVTPAAATNPVTPAIITVTLNTNAAQLTTAQRLVNAITSSGAANALVKVTIPVGAATTDIATPVTINPLTLEGANDESSNSAFVQTSFNVAGLQVRFEAVPMGAAGNGINLTFSKADLGVAGLPSVSVLGNAISVTLNTNKLSTPLDLISALTANAAASRLVRTLVVSGNATADIATPSTAGAVLTLGGGTESFANAGYFARTDPVNNEVVYRFAQPLPDDLYRIEVYGKGPGTILRNTNVISPATAGEAYNNGFDSHLTFDLDLGAQVTAVVPQPVLRNKVVTVSNVTNLREGDRILLTAGGNQVVLEFNDTQTGTNELPGNVPVSFDSTQLGVAGYANTVATAIATAIAGSGLDATASAVGAAVTIAGRAFNPTASFLASSAVAAGIAIADGGLTQRLDIVTVNFNEDPLNPAEANNPAFYQLIDTSTNAILIPTSVIYDSTRHTARLQFASNLPTSTFRLRIGESAEANNITANAINVGTVFTTTGYSTTAVIGDNTGVALPDDVDLYKFLLNSAATGVTITATPLPAGGTGTLNVVLRLFNSVGTEIGVATDLGGAGVAELRNTGALLAGTYYVGVSSSGNAGYDAVTGSVAGSTATTTGSYQLAMTVAGASVSGSDDNSSFGTASNLGILGTATQSYSSQIEAQSNLLVTPNALAFPPLPGGSDDPGHRDIPAENHGAGSGTTPVLPSAIPVFPYFFGNAYGVDAQGNTLFNQINAAEKQRTREIFEIFASRLGMEFRETTSGGLQVVTGDPRVAAPTLANPPPGIQGGPGVIMSAGLRANNGDDYGGAWMSVAFHEIGHAIGLGHSYDIPSIQGNGLVGEQVFTGDFDWIHALRNHPPLSTDIDLYKFTVAVGQSGTFTAETTAERLVTTSLLNTALTLYSENGTTRTLIARNDDYYSNDSFLSLHLDPGTYYIGVTSTGNTNFDPTISDSGYGGTTDGNYTLQLSFNADPTSSLHDVDAVPTNFDGDADRQPGGVYEFDFQGDGDGAHTIHVDKSAPSAGANGSLTNPFNNLQTAVSTAAGRIVVPTTGGATIADAQTFVINDGLNPAVIFEFDNNAGLTSATRVRVPFTVGDSPSTVATSIATAITTHFPGFPPAAIALPLNTTAVATGDRVDLTTFNSLNVAGTPALVSGVNILRIAGNGGADNKPNTINNNLPYQVGRNDAGAALADGATFDVPQGVTVMIDAGAIIKLQGANLDVGTSSVTIDRGQGAMQVLGTPTNRVYFTSWHNDAIGGDSDAVGNPLASGNWGGLVFRSDSDLPLPGSGAGLYLNYVNHADLSYGGGTVIVNSVQDVFDPIHLISTSARPTRPNISHNRITFSADAAISADPNSFNDVNGRIGPDIHNNQLFNNSTNGLFVRIRTQFGSPLDTLDVQARFNDTDIVHVITENLVLTGNPGGPLDTTARLSGRLNIDPGLIVKLRGSRIELDRGASRLIAEGTAEKPIRFTSLLDDRFGSGATFDTGADGNSNPDSTNGDWGGLIFEQASSGSLDHIYLAYAGGTTPIEGSFDRFNPIEVRQANLRLSNSLIENNASGLAATNRKGRGVNNASTIFVLGSQPLIVNNIVQNNLGNFISINANSLVDVQNADYGRSTGAIETFTQFAANTGPLIRLNRLDLNGVNGMHVRGEQLTVSGLWDDTDIVHVLQTEVSVNNLHTYGGLRLQSDPDASLVVKLQGNSAGFTANGSVLDINDRIGGTVQVLGQPGFPVVMTSLTDCSIGAGFKPDGNPQTDTLNSGQCDPSAVQTGTSGAVVIDGGDRDDHGSALVGPDNIAGTPDDINQTGWLFIQQMVNFAIQGSKKVTPNDVLVIGVTANTQAARAITSVTTVLGLNQAFVTGAAISAVNFDLYKMIYVPSDNIGGGGGGFGGNVQGGITAADEALLAARRIEIQTYVNTGGSLVALTESDSNPAYNFLQLPLPFQIRTNPLSSGGGGGGFFGATGPLRKTPAAIAAGFTITDVDLGLGTPYHNVFTGPAGFNGLVPFVLDTGIDRVAANADDDVVTLGLASGSFGIGVVNPANAGDWRSIQLNQYSNDRNVGVYIEREKSLTGNVDLNGNPTTAEFLGQLAPDDKSGDDLRRLGYEVHGNIASDAPTDVDVYSFSANAGTEVWLDIDRTSSALDTMVELIDANGVVVARSLNNSTLSGTAQTIIKEPNQGGDYFSQNPRDAGLRVILPGTVGVTGTYFVRVRSQPVVGQENTLVGQTSGRYQLQVRLQQTDEFPGSTVSYSDLRFATNGVEANGLPYHSPLLGDSEETTGDNNNTNGAQQLGNLLFNDRNTISTAGDISSATDVDFYRFNVDYSNIQVVPGLNAPTTTTAPSKTWATTLDVDYANGLTRTDSTLSLYTVNAAGVIQLAVIGRDSSIIDDQPSTLAGQGNDLDDLTRGTVGKLDPFLGSIMLPTGLPGQDSATYLAALSSDQLIPMTLNAQFDVASTNQLTRLEPTDGVTRVVEDHIGFNGYHSNGANTLPTTPLLIDISSTAALSTEVVPFTLNDVLLFANQRNDIFTVNPSRGGRIADLTTSVGNMNLGAALNNNNLQDTVMRSDGVLFGFERIDTANNNTNNGTAGALVTIDTATGLVLTTANDAIPSGTPAANNLPGSLNFEQVTNTDDVDALTFRRANPGGAAQYDLYYSVRDSGFGATTLGGAAFNSKLYLATNAGSAAAGGSSGSGIVTGVKGDIQLAGTDPAAVSRNFNDGTNNGTISLQSRAQGTQANNNVRLQINLNNSTTSGAVLTGAGNGVVTIQVNFDFATPAGVTTLQTVVDTINGVANVNNFTAAAQQILTAVISGGNAGTFVTSGGPMTLVGATDDASGFRIHGNVTGLAFGNFSNGTLYGVTSGEGTAGRGSQLISINRNNGNATIIADYSALGIGTAGGAGAQPAGNVQPSGSSNGFQGLALGPQNLNGGAFANMLFATTVTGDLYAIDPTILGVGSLQSVFDSNNDGVSDNITVNSGVGSATGLAFSPLDFNLWHPTDRRGAIDQPGHGINAAFDNSRTPGNEPVTLVGGADSKTRSEATGGASLYFGLDNFNASPSGTNNTYFQYAGGQGQLGILNEDFQRDLTSNAAIPNTYNLPGGALGSLVTGNSFSLAGYDRTDKPTLYFNYLLQTEGANADNSQSGARMRDSARVSISTNGGASWQLVATNNSILSTTATSDAELPSFLSVSRQASTQSNQQAQELFETTSWRQARIDLADYAGQANLLLRFDFTTAGTMGTFGTATHNSATIGLPGDENGLFQDGGGEFARTRGQTNQNEGFFVDDIVVGFAERGEMVTSATNNLPTSFNLGTNPRTTNPDPQAPKPQLTGEYQLEIRRGTEYASVVDPTKIDIAVGFNYDTNDRLLTTATYKNAAGVGDDFESGDFTGAGWQPLPTAGPTDKPFIVTSTALNLADPMMGAPISGTFSARSFYDPATPSVLPDGQRSRLQISVYTGDGDITFTRRISSEAAAGGKAGDVYRFFIDVSGGDFSSPLEELSGIIGPTTVSFHVDAGIHTFLWEYLKDGSGFAGQDGFFLDDILFPSANKGLGDQNFHREQGQLLIANNLIRNVSAAGIVIAAAPRDAGTNGPHPGSPINFDTLNTPRLAPGVAIANNVVTDFVTNGISFAGEPNTAGNVPAAAVPFGRIVNNTIYGGSTAVGTGIRVSNNASPTILNNVIANTTAAMVIDASSSTGAISSTQTGTFVFQGNTALGTVGAAAYAPTPNDILLLATDPLFLSTTSFYLASGSRAIDSSINVLPDRPEYVAVTGALGIPPTPIFAPDHDLYGQLRRDDPSQASFPGLGSNIFKDRGAVERADFLGPIARMISPLDNDTAGIDLDATGTNIFIDLPAGSAPLTQFTVEIQDAGIGVDDVLAGTSLKYTLQQDGVTLFDGVDYQFVYNANTNRAIFTSVSTFPLDSRYTLTIANSAALGIKDLAGNALQGNQPNGTVVFTILVTNGLNDAPVNTVSGPQALVEDGTLIFTVAGNNAISISDPDAFLGTNIVQVTLTVTNGTLTLGSLAGLNFAFSDGNGAGDGDGTNDANMEFRGLVTAVNTALAGLRFTPNIDFNGSAVLTITTNDLGNFGPPPSFPATDTDTISITVVPVNDQPTFAVVPNQPIPLAPLILEDDGITRTINLSGIAAARPTATDELPPAGTAQSLNFSVASSIPGFFSVLAVTYTSADTTGTLDFRPATNASGFVTVTLTLTDNGGTANAGVNAFSQNFTIFVTPVNDPPVAAADNYSVNEDTTLTVLTPGVLQNDSDPNDTNPANILSATLVSTTTNGVLVLNANGSFTYTPNSNFNGTDSFVYRVSDDGGQTNGGNDGNPPFAPILATVTITVNGINDAPVNTLPATYTTNEDITLTLAGISIVDVDSPTGVAVERVTLSVTTGTLSLNGVAGLTFVTAAGALDPANPNNNGINDAILRFEGPINALNTALNGMTFLPASNKFGSVTLTMTTNDLGNTGLGGALSDTDTSAITVNSVNDAPVGVADSYATAEDTPIVVAASVGVLANDGDPNDTPPTGTGPKNAISVNGATPAVPLVLASANGGSVTLNSNGSFIYTPPLNFVGFDTFTYRVRDDGLTANGGNDGTNPLTAAVTVTVDVGGINDPPVNNLPAPQTTIEDTPLVFSILNGNQISVTDPDAGGNPVRVTLSVNNGTLTLSTVLGLAFTSGDGIADASMTFSGALIDINTALNGMSFVPTLDFHGSATLSIISNDLGNTGLGGPQGDSDSLAITILASNDAPIAVADSYSTNEDATLSVSAALGVLFNDGDPHDVPANQLFANLVTGPTNGVLTLNLNGSFSYAPSLNFNGVDTFTYRVSDSGGTLNNGVDQGNVVTVTITVNPVNDAPVNNLPAAAQSVFEDNTLVFGAANAISVTDVDAAGSPLRITLTATDGVLTLSGLTGLTFSSGDGTADPSMAFTGTIAAINAALNGLTLLPAANFNTPGTGTGRTATVNITTNDQGFTGAGSPLEDSDTVFVTVNPVNDPPVAQPDFYSTSEDTTLTVAATGVLGNDSDPLDNPANVLSATLITTTTSGTLTFSTNGGFTYVPNLNFNGTDSFTYQVRDNGLTANGGNDTGNTVTVTIGVGPVNDPPVNAVPGPQAMLEERTLVFSAANGNLISTSDIDAGAATVRVTLTAGSGTTSLGSTTGLAFTAGDGTSDASMTFSGTLAAVNAALAGTSFTPSVNFTGIASLSMTTSDLGNTGTGGAQSDTDLILINVANINDPPVALPDAYSVNEDTTLTILVAAGVLANDNDSADTPSDMLTATKVTDPQNGIVTFNANGSFTYVPNANFNGSDSFNYTVSDDGGILNGGNPFGNTVTVTITVNAVNDAPVNSVPGAQTTLEDTARVFNAANGNLISVTDVDAASGAVRVTLTGVNGTSTLGATAGLTFTTGDGTSDASMTFTGTLAAVNAGLNGLSFAPTANFAGNATLTITTNDQGNTGSGGALSDTDAIAVSVTAVNDPPVAVGNSYSTNEDTPLTVSTALGVLTNDSDPNDTPANVLSAVKVTDPLNGTVSLNADGSFTYTPALDYNGPDSFQYQVQDNGGVLNGGNNIGNTVTVSLTVNAVNDAPVNNLPAAQSTNEDTVKLFTSGLGNAISITDVDAGSSAVRVTLTSTNGTLTLSTIAGLTFTGGDGTTDATMTFTGTVAAINTALAGMSYTPTTNFNGAATLTITTNDQGNAGSGGVRSDTDTLSITVNAVNDAPVNSVPVTQTTNDEDPVTFSAALGNAITVSDVDAGNALVRLSLTPFNGSIQFASTAGLNFVQGNGSPGIGFIYDGTVASLNAALNGLQFRPATDFHTTAGPNGAALLTVTTEDQGNTGSGTPDPKSDTDTITITVNDVNDPPINILPGVQTVLEDGSLVFNVTNGNAVSITDVDARTGILNVVLTATNGTLSLGSIPVGITFVPGAGDGVRDAAMSFTGTLANLNTALTGLTFFPNANFNGSARFTMTTNDQGNSGSGGSLSDTDTVFLTTTPVNDVPTIGNLAQNLRMAVAGQQFTINYATLLTALSGSDIDGDILQLRVDEVFSANGTLTKNGVAVVPGVTSIGPNEALVWTPPANVNASLGAFTLRAVDTSGAPSDAVVTVTIDVAAIGRYRRSYNPRTDYHFFTMSQGEFNNAVTVLSYSDETTGRAGFAVATGLAPVTEGIHRLYNPNNNRHYYTHNTAEKNILVALGYRYENFEGYIFTAQVPGTVPVFRLYNNISGSHLLTESVAQRDAILAQFPGVWVRHDDFGFVFPVSASGQPPILAVARSSGQSIVAGGSLTQTATMSSAMATEMANQKTVAAGTLSPSLNGSTPRLSAVRSVVADDRPLPQRHDRAVTPLADLDQLDQFWAEFGRGLPGDFDVDARLSHALWGEK